MFIKKEKSLLIEKDNIIPNVTIAMIIKKLTLLIWINEIWLKPFNLVF